MSSEIKNQLVLLMARGNFAGRRIVIYDPDDLSGRTRNVYEDLDQELGQERMALVTLYPEYAIAQSTGDNDDGLVEITHEKALKDIERMMTKFGYRLLSIVKDVA